MNLPGQRESRFTHVARPPRRRATAWLAAAALTVFASAEARAAERFITVASTTSTENSGLFEVLLPRFEAETGIAVRVVAVGTGQAVRMAMRGDADVLFVHHEPSETRFVAEGHGVKRYPVMYNDFVLVGPSADPAGVRGFTDAARALAGIAGAEAPFASRGDDSGTHKKEQALWGQAGVDAAAASGAWYRETGAGMGATLNTASAMGAYTLTDRATWLKFANKGDLEILVEGDPNLFNQYGIVLVDPKRHPHIKAADGQAFIDWLISSDGQDAIGNYTIEGQRAFFPNAGL